MKHIPEFVNKIRSTVFLTVVLGLVYIIGAVGCTFGGGGTNSDGRNDDSGCTDRDRDGYYAEVGCGKNLDCNDRDASIHPGAREQCVGIDNDCDGVVDDGCVPEVCDDGVDNDGDGVIDEACRQGASYVSDTGQARCYNTREVIYPCPSPGQDFYGQDACYSFNSTPFTKLDINGNALPDDALSWAMVKDNVTLLTWEVKADDDSLLDMDYIFDWAYATGTYMTQLNTTGFGGYTDWRLPTIKELSSIADFNIYAPAINGRFFPNTISNYYWSSTVNVEDETIVFTLNFFNGAISGENKGSRCFVRAVRGGVFSPTFTDNADGTITATANGKHLMWARDSSEDVMTWLDALGYCEDLTLAGYSDWRLPNIKELRSVVDYERSQPAIDLNYFPDTEPIPYWSSTTYAIDAHDAWTMGFYGGGGGGGDKSYSLSNSRVRAVRGGSE